MKRLMLDSHVLLWTIGKSEELSPRVTELLSNRENDVYISAISLWEIALKQSIGKLQLSFAIEDIPDYCTQMGFYLLPLKPLDALGFLRLPPLKGHKDPFDRMLIWQCMRGNYVLVSKDEKMRLYENNGLEWIW